MVVLFVCSEQFPKVRLPTAEPTVADAAPCFLQVFPPFRLVPEKMTLIATNMMQVIFLMVCLWVYFCVFRNQGPGLSFLFFIF